MAKQGHEKSGPFLLHKIRRAYLWKQYAERPHQDGKGDENGTI